MDINNYRQVKKDMEYIDNMRPVFKEKALFSDLCEEYVKPIEPRAYDELTIRFRAGKDNIDRVYLVTNYSKDEMDYVDGDELFDYYETTLQLNNRIVHYYFEVSVGVLTFYYDSRGTVKSIDDHYRFTIIPGFRSPSWIKGNVCYQIYVDRFYNGDPSNDVENNEYAYLGGHVKKISEWKSNPAQSDVANFYGGDLRGVMEKLDYLERLGVGVIYFNPIFVSPSNHKYDSQDYDYIDPHYGEIVVDEGDVLSENDYINANASKYINRVTNKLNLGSSNEMFIHLVEEAHKRNMKVILDGVFNHCGSFNKWMDKEGIYNKAEGYEVGAYQDKNSPYNMYFRFMDNTQWPNPKYDGWWGHDTLPKLNYEGSRQLIDEILRIGRKWVSPPYNVDGWRLDVAADLGFSSEENHRFWKEFRKAVKGANPNAVILAEHYGNPDSWLQGDEWDTVMNYDAFMEPVSWFFTGMEKHSDDRREDLIGNSEAFWQAMRYHEANLTYPSISSAMNELSNHDHSRFLTRTNGMVGRISNLGSEAASVGIDYSIMRLAVTMQMTWKGVPTIYYGDEAGVCGFTDPDSRRTYPWGNENKELIEVHRGLIKIREDHIELRKGALKKVIGQKSIIAYGRMYGDRICLVIFNHNNCDVSKKVNVWALGVDMEAKMRIIYRTDKEGFSFEQEEVEVYGGRVKLELKSKSAMILEYRDVKEYVPKKSGLTFCE